MPPTPLYGLYWYTPRPAARTSSSYQPNPRPVAAPALAILNASMKGVRMGIEQVASVDEFGMELVRALDRLFGGV